MACVCACALALSGDASAPYASDSPQRLMVFHTRRTLHDVSTGRDVTEFFYWVPKVDVNTPHSVDMYGIVISHLVIQIPIVQFVC